MDEVAYFAREKGRFARMKADNPIGFLIDAVPRCLSREKTENYRRQKN